MLYTAVLGAFGFGKMFLVCTVARVGFRRGKSIICVLKPARNKTCSFDVMLEHILILELNHHGSYACF